MFVVDTNVLVYSVDKTFEEHKPCFEIIENLKNGYLPWFLTWSIVYEFLRVTTHPKVFKKPLKIKQALNYIDSLLSSQNLKLLVEGPEHAEIVSKTLSEINGIKGNLLHDSHTAVLMREHGISKIYTRDNDFHMFSFLEVIDPLNIT